LLYVPRAQIITAQVAAASDYGALLTKHKPGGEAPKEWKGAFQNNVLATFLLSEAGKADSPFVHYQNIFPTDFSEFPLTFDDKTLETIRGS
jgi:hypothetical protein